MEPILNAHYQKFLRQFPSFPDLSDSSQFERFANYVILSRDHQEIFAGDLERLEAVSVGGPGDLGIDGLAFKVNGRLVTSIQEARDVVSDSRAVEIERVS
jgi:hypothetical protein